MKKFEFSLEKVLSYKNQTLDVLKNELALLNHQLIKIEEKIAELELVSAQTNQKLQVEMAAGVTSANIGVYKIYLNDISVHIRQKYEEKVKQLNRIASKQKQIINANIEIASLDKLKAKQQEEYRLMYAKAQEIELNEFITNLAKY